MKRYSISGVFVERPLTGVTRYCWELMTELDELLNEGEICLELVLPKGIEISQKYKNIKIVHYGKKIKFFWLNILFPIYILKNHSVGVHLGVNVPWLKPDIVCIYDVNSIANPQFFSKYHVFKTKLEKAIAVKHSKKVFSISQFSVDEIVKYLKCKTDDIDIVPCAWQHMNRINTNGDSKSRFGIDVGQYYFSMSSVAPTKNFKWVIEAAKQNPKDTFIIAGGTDPKTFGISALEEELKNVNYVGRISDEDAKILMRDCKAFLFPSYYEGFGIPPMEALACGAPKVVISDIPVMHEVCETSACYIDPFGYKNIDMNLILNQNVSAPELVLDKYSWKDSAERFLRILKNTD